MSDVIWLQLAYGANIFILAPVCLAIFAGRGHTAVFQGAVASAPGLELLIGSLWLTILVGSAIGLAAPQLMIPLLAAQVLYKSVWLATYVAPTLVRGGRAPIGVAGCFLAIVLTWPVLLVLALG